MTTSSELSLTLPDDANFAAAGCGASGSICEWTLELSVASPCALSVAWSGTGGTSLLLLRDGVPVRATAPPGIAQYYKAVVPGTHKPDGSLRADAELVVAVTPYSGDPDLFLLLADPRQDESTRDDPSAIGATGSARPGLQRDVSVIAADALPMRSCFAAAVKAGRTFCIIYVRVCGGRSRFSVAASLRPNARASASPLRRV